MNTFAKGNFVRFKKEYADGDFQPYVLVSWNQDRGLICPVSWEYGSLAPMEMVEEKMIEPANP